jgi:hypothetical protein
LGSVFGFAFTAALTPTLLADATLLLTTAPGHMSENGLRRWLSPRPPVGGGREASPCLRRSLQQGPLEECWQGHRCYWRPS